MTILLIILLYISAIIVCLKHLFQHDDDPCWKCPVYKYENCAYVDGPYCNVNNCEILKQFNETHVITDSDD